MFNKYWRAYPWTLQVALFLLMVFTLLSFFSVVIYLVLPWATGVSVSGLTAITEQSSRKVIQAGLLAQAINHMSLFLFPSLLFAYLTHPRLAHYLGLRQPGKPVQWLLAVLFFVSAMPFILTVEGWINQLDLGVMARELRDSNQQLSKAFMKMEGPGDLMKALIVMAVLPGIGEELFFRGIIMRFIHRRTHNILIAIVFSAVIFALFHFSVYSFISILISGILLGLVYYLTGSLWCNVLCHFLHNGLQIALIYLSSGNASLRQAMEGNSIPWTLVAAGSLLAALFFFLLWKNRTPLGPRWSDDYTAAELMEEAQ